MSEKRTKVYSPSEIESRLKRDLPRWSYGDGLIRRRIKTADWRATLMAINTIGHLAEAAWHHPEILASYSWLEVRLNTHDSGGVTDKDFELAKKIDEVVGWRPGKEGGALEGTPADALYVDL